MGSTAAPGADSPGPTSVRWRIVGLLLAYSFMSWFNRVSLSVAYDEHIKKELHISPEAMGGVYSALLFAYMACMTPGGMFADRAGPWLALVLMGLGSGVFCILTALPGWLALQAAEAVLVFILIRAGMGIMTAPIYPASSRIIAHWLPFRQRALANGLVMAAALVGIASTFYGFGTLVDVVGWPAAFLVTGTFTALVALLWAAYATDYPWQHAGANNTERRWIGEDSATPPAHEPAPPWWTLLGNRSLLFLTLSYAAIGYFEYLFYFWMHYYFEDVLKLGKDRSRLYATIGNLAMACGMALGGWLSDRLQRRCGYRLGRALVAGGGMLAGAFLLLFGIFASEPIWILIWIALAMAAVGATEGPFWATALDLGGRHGATAAGIFNTGGNIGGALAPVLTPVVSGALGWQWGIGLGGVVCLVGVVFWLWIDPAEGS